MRGFTLGCKSGRLRVTLVPDNMARSGVAPGAVRSFAAIRGVPLAALSMRYVERLLVERGILVDDEIATNWVGPLGAN